MPDVYAIFRGAPERHRILEAGWPDLYAAFVAATTTASAGTATRHRPCELRTQHPDGARPAAVGRISPGGPAGCPACLRTARPGNPSGHPL